MVEVAAEQELYRACRIIFGSELKLSREFLEYIQTSGVKRAFRQRAMETHPDRLRDAGELARQRNACLFQAVQQAYEQLLRYVEAREKGFRLQAAGPALHPEPGPGQRNAASKGNGRSGPPPFPAGHYQGAIPERPLLFGRYLYYTGLVSWQSIIDALTWQRGLRPRLGEIARQRGWLNSEKVSLILQGCYRSSLPFGQQAVRQGLLSRAQLQTLIFEQRRQHRKLGQFFVSRHLLTSQQLQILLFRFLRHNARHSRTGSAWARS